MNHMESMGCFVNTSDGRCLLLGIVHIVLGLGKMVEALLEDSFDRAQETSDIADIGSLLLSSIFQGTIAPLSNWHHITNS